MKKTWFKLLLAILLLVVMISTLVVGLAACEEKDRDPSHYNYYTCTHCHGKGCGWCNGTGVYASKK